jgi:hypothetical protein
MAISRSFAYTTFTNASGQEFYRPLITIQLLGKTKVIQGETLVDSGADICVLPYQLGLDLGFVWEKQIKSVPLSGVFASYETRTILVRISDFAEVPLIFAWSNAPTMRLILGQTNFFNRFNITFRLAENIFEITPSVVNQ